MYLKCKACVSDALLFSKRRRALNRLERFSLPPCHWLTLNPDGPCVLSRLKISLVITVTKIDSYLCFLPYLKLQIPHTLQVSLPRIPCQNHGLLHYRQQKTCRVKEGGLMEEAEIRNHLRALLCFSFLCFINWKYSFLTGLSSLQTVSITK